MKADGFSLAATIVLIFPMLYFFIATLTFFLAKLEDPIVTWMLRGLFNIYFLSVGACCAIGVVAFALDGRPVVAAGAGLIAVLAVAARRWFLRRMDADLRARDAGDALAVRRLRRLHLGGMLYNVTQFAAVLVSIPFVFATTA